MPEELTPQPKIEKPLAPLERDIDRLAGEIAKHKENPETAGAPGLEVVKQALRSMTPPPSSASTPADDSTPNIPDYAKDASPGTKLEIEELVEKAFKEGILKANEAASKSSPYVLDAFHDALAGKLYPELKKRNLVE